MDHGDPSLIETVAQSSSGAIPVQAASTPSSISSSSSLFEEGRFIAGTLLAGRYRILGLLGRGGMGEVYRATDLMLGQSVALKFLPEAATRDQRLLERFQSEVRIARQVSHPNVCRVYDIGQIDQMPFISMEYVDGEDLASLLLRIGRLPADKALETARKLCAGLAAAHDRGVIHRDLKPQNIMINKRGDVVIMDFGLAAVAAQLTGPESRNGTPAYMSPEQLKGAEVTALSDIYALGLVLYELFTGRRPYEAKGIRQLLELQESAQLTSVVSIASDVDPSVDRVIRRCLDPEPSRRPRSALSVAAFLPGGDPLAEALAAGEMPSPELVAASGKVEGLDKKYSIPLLIVTIACLFASLPVRTHSAAVLHAPLDFPPDALQSKAREISASFGYSAKPADAALWIEKREKLVTELAQRPQPRKWDQWLAAESPIYAIVRESPSMLIATPYGEVTDQNPPFTTPGMIQVNINGDGRLSRFEAVPLPGDGVPLVPPDVVFKATGFDLSKFTEKTAAYPERYAHDAIRSWSGPHPVLPGVTVKMDVAWWKGRVTLVSTDLQFPAAAGAAPDFKQPPWMLWFTAAASATGVFFGVLMARRNWKMGRGDRNGALRLAWVTLIAGFTDWIARTHPVPDSNMLTFVFASAGERLFEALIVWILYLALEPAVRGRWPHSLVSWNRLLAGKWLDAQVGTHVLIGAATGSAIWVGVSLVDILMDPPNTLESGTNLWATLGTRHWIGANALQIYVALMVGLIGFLTIFGMRVLLRNDIVAAIAAAVVFTASRPDIYSGTHLLITIAIWIALYAALIFTLLRFGLVATIAAVFFINSYQYITVGTANVSWITPPGIATLVLLIGIAVFAFWRSLGNRDLIGADQEHRP